METNLQAIGSGYGQSSVVNTNSRIPASPHADVISKFGQSLTDDQRSSILKTIDVLQEAGESFDEIKEVVDGFLEDNGIALPSQIGQSLPTTGPSSNKGVISQISADELSSVIDQVKAMRSAEASFDEVKDFVDNFLKENNIKPPNMGGTFVDVLT